MRGNLYEDPTLHLDNKPHPSKNPIGTKLSILIEVEFLIPF